MRPILTRASVVAALILLLGGVPLPETVLAGNPPEITAQQWERTQQKQQLIRERFDKLLQQARAQQRLIMAWQKKARLQQAQQKSQFASKRDRQNIAVAASR
jgi:hypothetical protein